jgi:hypothetical protein
MKPDVYTKKVLTFFAIALSAMRRGIFCFTVAETA